MTISPPFILLQQRDGLCWSRCASTNFVNDRSTPKAWVKLVVFTSSKLSVSVSLLNDLGSYSSLTIYAL